MGPHGAQTARILERLEAALQEERPGWVVVYGDTNSTLAAVLDATKLQVPVAHVETGMPSCNRKMPEEINRMVADHLASFHLCATQTGVANLDAEGIREGVHWVGDAMLDLLRLAEAVATDSGGVQEAAYLSRRTGHQYAERDGVGGCPQRRWSRLMGVLADPIRAAVANVDAAPPFAMSELEALSSDLAALPIARIAVGNSARD